MTTPWRRRCVWLPLLMLLLAISHATAQAPPSQAPLARGTLEYRQVFVPNDRLGELIKDYTLVKRTEFARLLAAVNAAPQGPSGSQVRLVEAEYFARLEQSEFVGGTARLVIENQLTVPGILRFEPCSLAIQRPRLRQTPNAPAQLGTDPAGQMVVLVDPPSPAATGQPATLPRSELQFDWNLRGARDPAGALIFDLRTPLCPRSRLTLDLPTELTPVLPNGIVVRLESTKPEAATGRQHWLIEIAGGVKSALSLVPATALRQSSRYVLLKQDTTYELSPQALECLTELNLDVYHEPLRQLNLTPDPSLQITSVKVGEKEVPWTMIAGEPGAPARLLIEFKDPLQGVDRVVRINGVSPLVLDQPWRLPRLRVEGVHWQEGTTALNVPPSLELRRLEPQGCRQTKVTSLIAPRAGESHQFQCSRADSALEAHLSRPRLQLQASAGLTLKSDGTTVSGRLVSDFQVITGATFDLIADVPANWGIDAVETVPASALDDWSVSASGRTQTLSVRLAQSIRPDRGVRLVVVGHRRSPQRSETLGERHYRMAQFRGAKSRQWVAVMADVGQQLGLLGDAELSRVDPLSLSENERSLMDVANARLIFLDGSAGENFGFQLRNESPRFKAQAAVKVTLSGQQLTESYKIRCLPEASSLARLLVQFTPARAGAVAWSLAHESEQDFTARRLSDEERPAGTPAEGDLWEVNFKRPRNFPVELLAERVTALRPGEAPRAVALVSLPQADSQSGEVEVHAAVDVSLQLDFRGLKPSLASPAAADAATTRRATFLYSPAQEQHLSIGHAAAKDALPPAWVWQARLISRIADDGQSLHSMAYDLENTGRLSITVTLPLDAQLRDVSLNGRKLASTATPAGAIQIMLPAGARFATIVVNFATPRLSLPLLSRLPLVFPEIDAPVLASDSRIVLPPAFDVADARLTSIGEGAAQDTWRRRLFGSLAPLPHQRSLSLFSANAWTMQDKDPSLSPSERRSADACWEAVHKSLTSLEPYDQTRLTTASGDEMTTATWGQWVVGFDRLARDNPSAPLSVDVDVAALARVGIDAQSPLPTSFLANQKDPSLLLRTQRLCLLLDDQRVVLTTRDRMFRAADKLRPVADGVLFVSAADGYSDENSFLPAANWVAQPAALRWPLPRDHENDELSALEMAGWRVYSLADLPSGQADIHLVRRDSLAVIAWSLQLLAMGLGYWLCRRSRRAYLVAVVLSSWLALFIPAVLAAPATGVFLGLILGGALRLVRRARGFSPIAAATPQQQTTVTHQLAAPLAGVMALAAIGLGTAAQVPAQAPAAAATNQTPRDEIYQVVVPVNDKQEPVGDYVYLPRPFYEALSRLAKTALAAPQGWLLLQADYQGRLEWETIGVKLNFAELVATYELQVFESNTQVTIPLGRENIHLLEKGVTLDGKPVRIAWLESGEGFSLTVPEPGRYRLDVFGKPAARVAGIREEVDIKIPRLARSRLVLRTPADATGVQIPRASGAQIAGPGEIRVDLGPAERLSVHWPSGAAGEIPAGESEVSQLLWWKLRPGATVLEATWHFKSTGQPLKEVRLVADPRLRLLPLGLNEPVAEQYVREGDVRTIHFVLKEPYEREVTLHTTFSLAGSSGVGSLTLPRLDAVADRVSRRWLAISAASTLEATVDPETPAEALSVQEFLTAWGETEASPQQAFRLASEAPLFALSARPREPQIVASEELTYKIENGQARVQLLANLTVAEGQVFQHTVSAPPNFQCEPAFLLAAGESRPVRIAESSPGKLQVFLPGGTNGQYSLLISGTVPLPERGPWTLPRLSVTATQTATSFVAILKTGQVSVRLAPTPGWEPYQFPTGLQPLPPPQAVAYLQPVAGAAATPTWPEVQIESNNPQWRAQQIVRIVRRDDAWQAAVDVYATNIRQGSLERMRWDIPSEFSAAARMSLPGKLELVNLPGQSRRQLLATFEAPQSRAVHVQLMIPLSGAPGERLQLPDLRLLDATPVETFVVLPGVLDKQQLVWETRGLQAAELPRDHRELASADTQSFIAVGPRYQASVQRMERSKGPAQITLADFRVTEVAGQGWHGVASFDLLPAGLTHCHLQIPRECDLVHVQVAEHPAIVTREDETHWRIMLHHEELPQRIEILYTLADPQSGISARELTLNAPALVNIPIELTTWTVVAHRHDHRSLLANPELVTDGWRQVMQRLKNSSALLEHAAGSLADGDPNQVSAWFLSWARHNRRAREEFAHLEASNNKAAQALAPEIQAVSQEQQAIAQQFGALAPVRQAETEDPAPFSLSDLEQGGLEMGATTVSALTTGSETSLLLRREPLPRWEWAASAVAAGVILLLAAAVLYGGRSAVLQEVLTAWPQSIGIFGGLAWWLFLTPSFIGLAIAILFAIVPLRWHWPAARPLADTGFSLRSSVRHLVSYRES